MAKWYARTCSTNSDGDICRELFAPTSSILAEKVRSEPANHWTVWMNRGDGEGRTYKETWTTLWFSEGEEGFGELFCTHSVDSKPLQPRAPEEQC